MASDLLQVVDGIGNRVRDEATIWRSDEMSDKAAADFMHDQLEALLASPALSRVEKRHSADREQAAASTVPGQENLAEPNIDVQQQGEASPQGSEP